MREAYGKGMTEDFAKASGLGELYEDVCNNIAYNDNMLFARKFNELSLKERGYCIQPTEKELTPKEILKHRPVKDEILDTIADGNYELAKDIVNMITDNHPIGLEYTNVLTGEKTYADKRISFFIDGSNGSAGGNDYYEAFNQGFSEIIERMHQIPFFESPNFPHTILTKEAIKNPKLIELYDKIEALGNKVYVIDCSYLLNLPVMAVLIVDLYNHRTVMDFGCFPIFDIALERCFTEIYQGSGKLHENLIGQIQVPYRTINPEQRVTTHFLVKTENFTCHPYEFFKNLKYTSDSPNWNVFLKDTGELNNLTIYNYYMRLIEACGWNVYVNNMSLSKNLAAVHILFDSFKVTGSRKHFFDLKQMNWDAVKTIYQMGLKMADNFTSEDYSYDKIKEIYNLAYIKYYPMETGFIYGSCFPTGPLAVLGPNDYFSILEKYPLIIDMILEGEDLKAGIKYGLEWDNLIKFAMLNRYKHCNAYSEAEIKDILKIFGIIYTDEDFKRSDDVDYMLEHIFILPYRDFYFSKDYKNIIRGLYKEE